METLLYFHPAPDGMYQKNAARRHWWQSAKILGQELPAKERESFFLLVDCPVPPYCYHRRSWTAATLSECIEEAVHAARGMADAWLHPDIMTLVSEKHGERWEPKRETLERIWACLLSVSAADCLKASGEAVVLLGRVSDTLWQMELTARLLEPYLPRINSLTFCYEEAGVDLWEEAADCLETYSYEYGLTPCLLPYFRNGERISRGRKPGDGMMADVGETGGLILDYGAPLDDRRLKGRKRAVYVDLQGSPLKERRCLASNGRILYVSPLKYLDTAVKSGYDKKMYATITMQRQ